MKLSRRLAPALLVGVVILPALTSTGDDPKKAPTADVVYEKKGPVEFLISLIRQEARAVKNVSVGDAPKGWIERRHIAVLVGLLDCNEPCASVGSNRVSNLAGLKDVKASTVGHEAAHLIEGYRHGLYPKYATLCSANVEIDKEALKRWWAQEQTSKRSTEGR